MFMMGSWGRRSVGLDKDGVWKRRACGFEAGERGREGVADVENSRCPFKGVTEILQRQRIGF